METDLVSSVVNPAIIAMSPESPKHNFFNALVVSRFFNNLAILKSLNLSVTLLKKVIQSQNHKYCFNL